MEYRTLGKSGLLVSQLCFGTLTFSPLQANLSYGEARKLLLHAHQNGVNLLDTAEYYENYTHIRQAGVGIEGMHIITKCHAYDRAGAKLSLDKALRETGRSCIDVMMLHEQESEWTLRGHAQALAYFYEQRTAGRIRAVGISTHFVACAMAAATMQDIDVIEAICNPRGLGIVDGSQQDMNEALAIAHNNNKGVIAIKALGGGHFSQDALSSLKTVLSYPFVDTVAVGMQSIGEIDYNVLVFRTDVRNDTLPKLNTKIRSLHIAHWCIGCGDCAKRCQSGALHLIDGKMCVNLDKCVLCGYCAAACREFCIKVY